MASTTTIAEGTAGALPKRSRLLAQPATIPTLLLAPCMLWIAFFFVIPLGLMVWRSLKVKGFSLAPYETLFTSPIYYKALINTFEISVIVTALALVLGYPIAYLLIISSAKVRAIVLILVVIPYWLDYIVRSFSWLVLLGRKGIVNNLLIDLGLIDAPLQLLNNLFSVLVGMVQIMLPLMILTLFGAMLRIDRTLTTAAEIHGATPWRAFWSIFFPLSLPGVYAASLLVFIISLGFYITPALLGSPKETMISQLIVDLAGELLEWELASAAGVLLLIISFSVVMLYNHFFSIDKLWGGRES